VPLNALDGVAPVDNHFRANTHLNMKRQRTSGFGYRPDLDFQLVDSCLLVLIQAEN